MRRGFTLIELLAVIVILAIIALIATPIVLSIIEQTKESAVLRSAEHYLSAVEQSIMKKNLDTGGSFSPNTCVVQSDGKLLCDGKDELKIEVSGEKPSSGTITFEKGKITNVELTQSNKTIVKNENGELVLGDKNEEVKLAPGLYDENDNLVISWADLTSIEYRSFTHYIEGVGQVTSPILRVEEGVLKSAYDEIGHTSNSAEYLKGKLVLDDSVTSIANAAFSNCNKLTSIIMPESVMSIGDSAFYGCSSLTGITIPNSVTSIGNLAFSDNKLTSITIPSSVTNIGYAAFNNNQLPDNQAFIYARNEDGSIDKTTLVSYGGAKRDDVIIPSSVTRIGLAAFSGNNLTSVTIPESVAIIEEMAFNGCSSLTIYYKGTATGFPWAAPNATIVTDF